MITKQLVRDYALNVLNEVDLALPGHKAGKVRDYYELGEDCLVMVTSDRVSVFDIPLTAVPFKGQVLNVLSQAWFAWTADICANHMIACPDPNVMVCKKLEMLPVEVIVRDYLAGSTATSVWTMYEQGRREMYGHRLPDGLRQNERLPETLITPTTKAGGAEHDAPLSAKAIVEKGLLRASQWEEVHEIAMALFRRGRDLAAAKGLILADTKYEFGWDANGVLTLADEVHTPDSSRFWRKDSYEALFAAGAPPQSFDKDVVRRWVRQRCDPYKQGNSFKHAIPEIPIEVISEAALAYVGLYEAQTSIEFRPPDRAIPPMARIRASLDAYLADDGERRRRRRSA